MGHRRKASETRKLIFEACSRILRREGLSNLTLDTVAAEVGLSKGGLLYHFPTKKSLIESLFEYHNGIFESRLRELAEAEEGEAGAWLRAYVKACIEQISEEENANLYASLFAAEEKYASANQLMQQKYVDWQRQVEADGVDPTWTTLVRLLVDGFWFTEMHRYAQPDDSQRQRIIELILSLSREPVKSKGKDEQSSIKEYLENIWS